MQGPGAGEAGPPSDPFSYEPPDDRPPPEVVERARSKMTKIAKAAGFQMAPLQDRLLAKMLAGVPEEKRQPPEVVRLKLSLYRQYQLLLAVCDTEVAA